MKVLRLRGVEARAGGTVSAPVDPVDAGTGAEKPTALSTHSAPSFLSLRHMATQLETLLLRIPCSYVWPSDRV